MATRTPSSRPASQKSGRSTKSAHSNASSRTTEETPLLSRSVHGDDDEAMAHSTQTTPLLRLSSPSSVPSNKKTSLLRKRWPSILALIILCSVFVTILFGFLATEEVEDYAKQAAGFKPTRLSLDSLTDTGVRVKVEGEFSMDASKVEKGSVRNIGRLGTWIARKVRAGATEVNVYVPEYGNMLLGTAKIPSITVDIRNGHRTEISFLSDLTPGSLEGIRNIANDWLEGRLRELRLKGKADVFLRSGLIGLGKQAVEHAVVLEGDEFPSLPHYNITRFNLREAKNGYTGIGADASLVVVNDYPVDLAIPPIAVDILVDNCMPSDPYIKVGTAESAPVHLEANTDLEVNVTGRVAELPDSFTRVCPDSVKSPLDTFLGNYMHGDDSTIYIHCCKFPDPETPQWTQDLLKDITVPVPFAGRDFGNMIKNFSFTDVQFHLPDLFAEPDSAEAQPKISALIKVDVGLPDEMNVPLDVDRVKADADVFYHKKKFGELHLDKWQKAHSSRVEGHDGEGPFLMVESAIRKAPLKITDDGVFNDVVQALIFGGSSLVLTVKAAVDVGVDTPIGKFAVREIPAEGIIPVKPIGHGGKGLGSHAPKIGGLTIIDTSPTSITLSALVNFTNPTKYSATVPYFNINILVNGTVLGQAIAEDIIVRPGNNTNMPVKVVWDPFTNSEKPGKEIGSELLSQYISGFNTSLTLQTHNNTIPAQPNLGFILSKLPVTLPTPHMRTPKSPDDSDGDDEPDNSTSPHFIQAATMHLLSSSAVFTLSSPLSSTTLYITYLNATSYYKTHPAGKILYDLPFAVPPGLSDSPRLPVDWSFGSVGYDAIKKALGGSLKLSAVAHVGIKVGEWNERVWYQGRSIGARIRL
ncbi:hypothetical protein GQ43DRAFT_378707 [Delitschia confertaspora ATCC 74209]|uniref:Pre-rrna processing protein n=1 Tax=Delitschia confertaspora ATCC 74209 TaxID=1513339 RepID=A0A9P4JKK4_9PLEO|nr:hypothetical protein GQ43DRAFT_378707 [Delitschia confertaspora ATCC 74209]